MREFLMTIKILIAFDLEALFNSQSENDWVRNPRFLRNTFHQIIELAQKQHVQILFEIISRQSDSLHFDAFKKEFESLENKDLSNFHHVAIQNDALQEYKYDELKTQTIRYLANNLSIPLQHCLFLDSNEGSLENARKYQIETLSITNLAQRVVFPSDIVLNNEDNEAHPTLLSKFNSMITKAKENYITQQYIDMLNRMTPDFNLSCLVNNNKTTSKPRLPYFANKWRSQSCPMPEVNTTTPVNIRKSSNF